MRTGRHGADIVRIGTGAGMADDRIFPGVRLLERGALDYLVKDVNFIEFVPTVVRRALSQLDKEQRLAAAEADRQRLAADNLGLADTAWRLGERPLEVLLRARTAAFDADSAALRARYTREQAEAWRDFLKGSAE